MRNHIYRKFAAIVGPLLVALVVLPSGSSSGSTPSAPGVTAKSITIGALYSASGVSAAGNALFKSGYTARIDMQNAKGGIHGRKIVVAVGDDQSSPAGTLTAAQSLIEQKQVFGIITNSATFIAAYKYVDEAGVPVTSLATDGPEWGNPKINNLFVASGASTYSTPFTTPGKFFKSQGCTDMANAALGNIPSAAAEATSFATSEKSAGLNVVLNDGSATLSSTDLSPVALKIKASNANCVGYFYSLPLTLSLNAALAQAGVKTRATYSVIGYGDISGPSSASAQGIDIGIPIPPVESNNAGITTMMNAVHKYTSYQQADFDNGIYQGWIDADLMIKGLQLAGPNPTRSKFESSLHGLTNYNAGGIGAGPVNLKQSLQGTWASYPSFGNCVYVATYKGTKWVPLNGSKPYCGGPIH
jgi:branched-chain amino acid transport system substrate-binding protein